MVYQLDWKVYHSSRFTVKEFKGKGVVVYLSGDY